MHIPNHHIEKKIGQGGMAKVYLAVHTIMKRQVALKVMSSSLVQEQGFKESFLHEGEVIAQLEHPNIVHIYDINIVDDIYYMSMEYLSGGSLKERLAKKKYKLPDCITLLQQVGAGLSFAHKNGYIHRDIKPANILFSRHGDAILTDFGIAKLQNTSSDLTKMGYMLGTAQYMSPEQATTVKLDQRSDVYSLGLIFYEMLIGEKVVRAKTGVQAIYCHANEPTPTFPNKYQHLQAVLNKVLAKEPKERFSTVQDFINALTEAADHKTIIQGIDNNTSPSLPTWIKPASIVATLSAIVIAGGFYFMSNKDVITSPATTKPVITTEKENTPLTITNTTASQGKKISHTYEPHVYYTQLEKELDTLAKETKELLALDPKNKRAKSTLNRTLNRYHDLAITLLKTMNLSRARLVIDKGLQISTNHKALKKLQKIAEREPNTLTVKEKKKINALNKTAETHIKSQRYTAPKGKNALEIYQNILVMDPQNKQATDKINEIVLIFEHKINNSIDKNIDQANKLLNQAIAIAPFNKNLIRLQQKIKEME